MSHGKNESSTRFRGRLLVVCCAWRLLRLFVSATGATAPLVDDRAASASGNKYYIEESRLVHTPGGRTRNLLEVLENCPDRRVSAPEVVVKDVATLKDGEGGGADGDPHRMRGDAEPQKKKPQPGHDTRPDNHNIHLMFEEREEEDSDSPNNFSTPPPQKVIHGAMRKLMRSLDWARADSVSAPETTGEVGSSDRTSHEERQILLNREVLLKHFVMGNPSGGEGGGGLTSSAAVDTRTSLPEDHEDHAAVRELSALEKAVEFIIETNLPQVCSPPCTSSAHLADWSAVLQVFDDHCPTNARRNLDRYVLPFYGFYEGTKSIKTSPTEQEHLHDGGEKKCGAGGEGSQGVVPDENTTTNCVDLEDDEREEPGRVLSTRSPNTKSSFCLRGLIDALLMDSILKWQTSFQFAFRSLYLAFLLHGYANVFTVAVDHVFNMKTLGRRRREQKTKSRIHFSDIIRNLNSPAADGFVLYHNPGGTRTSAGGQSAGTTSTLPEENAGKKSDSSLRLFLSPEGGHQHASALEYYWRRLVSQLGLADGGDDDLRLLLPEVDFDEHEVLAKNDIIISTSNMAPPFDLPMYARGLLLVGSSNNFFSAPHGSTGSTSSAASAKQGSDVLSAFFHRREQEFSARLFDEKAATAARSTSATHVIEIFQIDTHTACAGEFKRMLSEFEDEEFSSAPVLHEDQHDKKRTPLPAGSSTTPTTTHQHVEKKIRFRWHGYSLAKNICHNFGLCNGKAEIRDQFREIFEANRRNELDFLAAKKMVIELFHEKIVEDGTTETRRQIDFVLCTQPISFCRFFLDLEGKNTKVVHNQYQLDERENFKTGEDLHVEAAALAANGGVGRGKNMWTPTGRTTRIMIYIGLPLMWMLPTEPSCIFQIETGATESVPTSEPEMGQGVETQPLTGKDAWGAAFRRLLLVPEAPAARREDAGGPDESTSKITRSSLVFANSLFAQETFGYQFGFRPGALGVETKNIRRPTYPVIPLVPMLGLHVLDHIKIAGDQDHVVDSTTTNDAPVHLRGDIKRTGKKNQPRGGELLIGRSGMNGYLVECLLGSALRLLADINEAPRRVENKAEGTMDKRTMVQQSRSTTSAVVTTGEREIGSDDGLPSPWSLQLLEDFLAEQSREQEKSAVFNASHVSSSSTSEATPPNSSAGSSSSKKWTEIRTPQFPYEKLAEKFHAAVLFPYDAAIFLFHELYLLCVPILLPVDVWRYMQGPLTHPDMEWQAAARLVFFTRSPELGGDDDEINLPTTSPHVEGSVKSSKATLEQHEQQKQVLEAEEQEHDEAQELRFSPFQSSKIELHRPLEYDRAKYWERFSNFYFFPHVLYFKSVAEIAHEILPNLYSPPANPGPYQGRGRGEVDDQLGEPGPGSEAAQEVEEPGQRRPGVAADSLRQKMAEFNKKHVRAVRQVWRAIVFQRIVGSAA
ncbi:unnamed protein product [Amoebophrya sp. A120]|nr:unnamed protein product [Amoebophrya sp. A120]|eukprot:GSA120T00022180001.1